MDAETIVKEAGESIGKFCIEECKAYCCRKGYLLLTEKEMVLITNGRKNELEANNLMKQLKDSRYSLFMGKEGFPCPALKDFKCILHKSKDRPLTCKDFPLFLDKEKKEIRLSPRCLAVKAKLLYPYVSRLIQIGYKIQK